MINLYNKDCIEALKELKDNQFDLAIVDPPYGINADKKNSIKKLQSKKSSALSKDYGSQIWDNHIPTLEYFKELKRVSKNQIIWGVNYYPYNLLKGGRIYWDKCVTMPTYSDGELAYCSFINSIKSYRFTWHGMIQGDMKNKEKRIHPTQKPVKLYEWLLMNYANKGDKILDTHLGSGSIAIACHNLGFDLEGYELDKEYFEAANKRLKQHQQQIRMFK
jgi:site-specific DNA-methyltransferase (adenine-specific)